MSKICYSCQRKDNLVGRCLFCNREYCQDHIGEIQSNDTKPIGCRHFMFSLEPTESYYYFPPNTILKETKDYINLENKIKVLEERIKQLEEK